MPTTEQSLVDLLDRYGNVSLEHVWKQTPEGNVLVCRLKAGPLVAEVDRFTAVEDVSNVRASKLRMVLESMSMADPATVREVS